jgi:hypothetical protein
LRARQWKVLDDAGDLVVVVYMGFVEVSSQNIVQH